MHQRKIPCYFHIESLLRQRILTGQLKAGEKIPTERELMAQFGVSRITVRAALSNLVTEGLLFRRSGKGTFVENTVPQKKQVIVTGDLQRLVSDSQRYTVKPLGIENRAIQETRHAHSMQEFFRQEAGSKICMVKRTRLLGRTPVIYLENFLVPEIAEKLTLEELSSMPLQKLLKKKIDLEIGRTEAYLESVPADPDVAEILHVHVFAPLLLARAYLWFSSGEPFEGLLMFMRPDYFVYKIDLEHGEHPF